MDDELEELKKEIKIKKAHTSIKRKELKKLKEKIWNKLGLIKVYTKSPGKKSEEKPVALKVGATIEDLGEKIHKDFIKKFKYAKVFRKHGKIKEIQAGLKFVLKDEDIVEFHLK